MVSGELLGHDGILEAILNVLAEYFCGPDDDLSFVCKGVLFFACGFDPSQFPDELLPTILMHSPAGNSVRQATQYVQVQHNYINGEFLSY